MAAMFGWFRDASTCASHVRREPIRIEREGLRQHFDGDLVIELRVARAKHLVHASGADGCDDIVGAEAGAGEQSQERD
jgi:hypothetical protein